MDIVRNVLDDLIGGGPHSRVGGVGGRSGGSHAERTSSEEARLDVARSSGLDGRGRNGGGSTDDGRDGSACGGTGKGGLGETTGEHNFEQSVGEMRDLEKVKDKDREDSS